MFSRTFARLACAAAPTLAALAFALLAATTLDADTTAKERRMVGFMETASRRAARLAQDGKSRDALELVTKIQVEIDKLAGKKPDPDLVKILQPVMQQLKIARGFLELEGLEVPPLPKLASGEPMPKAEKPGDLSSDAVSFSSQVAPLLVSKCGRCHVADAKGRVSMSDYASLMQGHPEAGPIVMPGSAKGSRIFEVIESGDMPRGGGKLSDQELATLLTWIDQGAKNDARNDNIPLRQLARAATAAPEVKVAQATGEETVKFSLELAPVLAAQCNSCHGRQRPRADFSVATFNRLLRGGDSGPVVVPGKPPESLLIKKLKGTAGARMPLERPALEDETIAKFEKWIEEGAKFDGESPDESIARLAAVARARTLTPEELSKDRAELAVRNWRLAIPDDTPVWIDTENFLMVGNLGEGVLNEIAGKAEAEKKKVATALKLPAAQPLLKGKITIYVFANRFDYAEFGRMVERRPLPKSWRGHWHYDIVDPYILLAKPKADDEYSIEALLAQQLAALHVASRSEGEAPRWLAEGAGRTVAADLHGKDSRVAVWDDYVPDVLAQMRQPSDFMSDKMNPEDADLASYSFVKLLMSKPRHFKTLLAALEAGADIDRALLASYKATKGNLAAYWYGRTAKRR